MTKMNKSLNMKEKTLPNFYRSYNSLLSNFHLNMIKLMMKLIKYAQC